MRLWGKIKSADPVIVAIHLMVIILFAGLTMFVYLRWVDGNPPVVVQSPALVDKEKYVLGVDEEILLTAYVCRFTDVPALIFRSFINADGVVIGSVPNPILTGSLERGCQTVTVPISIPDGLSVGPHVIDFTGIYQVNAFATHSANWYTNQFLICDKSGDCGDTSSCAGPGCN